MHAPILYWQPEDRVFWSREGSRVARRNLLVSIPALMLSFAVWTLWSAVVVMLPRAGFGFTTGQLFWLAAAPGLAGGTLRLFYAFAVPIFGGRRWTVVSTLLLLVPAIGLALAVQDPATTYPAFLAVALCAGLGGGNFASSMANVSFFFPLERQGTALGLNAGLGNLGITLAQLVVPLAATGAILAGPQAWTGAAAAGGLALQRAGWIWVAPILVVAALAWRYMDDLPGIEAAAAEQAVVFVRRDTWVLAWLYLGTFGSLIGFAASFPLVTETQYSGVDVEGFAFAGPLAAALARPLGGWLADRVGGARVALASFVAMAAAVALLLAVPAVSFGAYLAVFAVLFVASGAGNGAVFQLIPAVFNERARASSSRGGPAHAAAVLGFASAIGAFGGFFIPKAYGTAVALTGGLRAALVPFLLFYLTCIAATAWFYLRRTAERKQR
ncbi:MAG TPA: MFS transporter [Usitatibacter sp.]|nr:MFS transporter [Usitatibacter sp.]